MGPSGGQDHPDIISKRKTEGKVLGKVRKHAAAKTRLFSLEPRSKRRGGTTSPRSALTTPHQVYFDGSVPSKSTVKKHTAYIQQQDCFSGRHPLQTILFAAMAKLPLAPRDDVADKHAKVSAVIIS